MALNIVYELYEYDLKTLYFVGCRLYLLIQLNRLEQAKIKAYEAHRLNRGDEQITLGKLLEIYIKLEDYHKASILEAEYEELIDAQNEEYKKKHMN